MSGGPKGAKRPLERPLDGGVRRHGRIEFAAQGRSFVRDCGAEKAGYAWAFGLLHLGAELDRLARDHEAPVAEVVDCLTALP